MTPLQESRIALREYATTASARASKFQGTALAELPDEVL